jgi:hypothetical protein
MTEHRPPYTQPGVHITGHMRDTLRGVNADEIGTQYNDEIRAIEKRLSTPRTMTTTPPTRATAIAGAIIATGFATMLVLIGIATIIWAL